MSEQDPGKLADELEQQADRLEAHGDEVGARIEEARQDWKQKRASEAVPGANPPDPQTDDEAEDQR